MVICEGGDTISENNYVIHSFKTVGVSTLKVIEGGLVEVLVVAGGNYTGTVMRSSVYYIKGTTDWRVPDDGKWFIRDTTYVEPNGDYTANAFLGLLGLNSDGSVKAFNDGYDYNYYTGTTIICSTNVKCFSYYN